MSVCPVNCIHPAPGSDAFSSEPMLYIDPGVCIHCAACADACPADAAVPADVLGEAERVYVDLDARHFERTTVPADQYHRGGPLFRSWDRPGFDWSLPSDFAGLDVAVVGTGPDRTGPAGLYAAELLLLHTRSTVTLVDRLPVPGGLVRYGVAPDHPSTKRVGHTLGRLYSHPRVRLMFGVDVGTDLAVEELAQHFDAVICSAGSVGTSSSARPG